MVEVEKVTSRTPSGTLGYLNHLNLVAVYFPPLENTKNQRKINGINAFSDGEKHNKKQCKTHQKAPQNPQE
jgi:hypothetical protein